MGAIQGAMNQAINSAAIAVAAGKEISADVKKKKAEEKQAKAATESIKSLTKNYNPQMFSPGATAFDQSKSTMAMMNMDFNKTGKYTQRQDFNQFLEKSKSTIKASRKTIGGKK